MKINYIKTIGFRKFEKVFETDLYDITNITGKNRSGKSNILYAIINIMLGTNLSGDEKSCLINKNCDASYGELHFTDNNGINHIIIRQKHKYSSINNFVSLDGKPVTQTDLISFYKDKKLFLSVLNPLYFLNKKPAEQKELVDKYLSDIKPKEIFDNLDKKQQTFLIEKYYKDSKPFEELTPNEQENFINLNILNIVMDISYNNLSNEDKRILEEQPQDIPTYISELNANIKKFENIISNLNGKIEYAQNIVNQELPKHKVFEKDVELNLARQELTFLNTNQSIIDKENQKQIVEKLEQDVLNIENECTELDSLMKTGKTKYLSIKNSESPICPTCNQHIQDSNKNITIINLKKELLTYYNKSNSLQAKLKDLQFNLSIERCKFHSLEGNTTIEKSKQISIVENNIKELEKEQLEIEKFNNEIDLKQKSIENAKADIRKFNSEKQTHTKLIDGLKNAKKIAQKLYISYIEEKMKLAKQHLKDVNIQFYSVVKTTGEIKDDFIITYKGIPLADLSRSETIATALEFANMFNKISRGNFPIFIDDYESCADYNFIEQYSQNTQLIISKVIKGSLLKVADANSDNYTILRPTIKTFRTLNTHKNNISYMPQVA